MPDDAHYFVGFPVPKDRREVLTEWQETLKSFVDYRKWVNTNDFHITIRFLGALSKQQLQTVKKELSTVKENAFETRVCGLNFFGKEDQPRVMYAEIEKNETILSIKNKVDEKLVGLNFGQEKRPYRPHITLAKKWRKGKLHLSIQALENKIDEEKYFHFNIDHFNLYRVHPDRKQKYEVIETFKL